MGEIHRINNSHLIREYDKYRLHAIKILYALIFILVYEGIIRKLLPSALGILIFFIKDILCLYAYFIILKPVVKTFITNIPFYNLRFIFLFLFLPCLIVTNFYDPVLMFFGLKQYNLYIIIVILVPFAFPPDKIKSFLKLLFFTIIMVIPTTIIAVLQNGLSASHWLNKSVDGESLESFSAGGILRVSSTFSFTGQYSMFLNFVAALIIVYICLASDLKQFSLKSKIFCFVLLVSFIIGAFVTGGRFAVLGTGATLGVGAIIAVIKSPQKLLIRGVGLVFIVMALISFLRVVKPEYFFVFELRSEREEHYAETNNGQTDFEKRITSGLFKWVGWFDNQDTVSMIFGNGVGVASNGVDRLSEYAAQTKKSIYVEGEMESVVFEGGIYLFLIWTIMKIYVNLYCLNLFKKVKSDLLSISIAFLIGYTLITAIYGYVSKQPPMAIYFWFTIGSAITLIRYSLYKRVIIRRIGSI